MIAKQRLVAWGRCAAALLFALAGCAQLPTNELTQYRQAFEQTKDVSGQMLLDFDQALKAAEANRKQGAKAPPQEPYSTEWSKVTRSRANGGRDDIETRRRAWEVIGNYNDVLTLLAEGKSVDAAKASADGLINSAVRLRESITGAGVPGLSAITGLVSIFVEQLERARLREEFVRAVRNGAPVVDGIFKAFMDDIGSHYEARAFLAADERLRGLRAMRASQRSIARITVAYNVPAPDLAKIKELVDRAFAVQKQEPAAALLPIASGGPGAAAYTELAKSQVDDEIAQLQASAAAYVTNIQQIQSLTAMLDEYQTLLRKTSTALSVLVRALDKPQDMAVATDELLTVAFSVRRNLEELKLARQ